jgi:hypothetical protein
MALHWQLPKTKTISSPHANDLIWFTLLAQIGRLTESNLPEFRRRLQLWQTHMDDFSIPVDVLPEFIGLTTNVSDTTKTEWNKWFVKRLESRLT